MTYRGTVKGGVVVLEGTPGLPEGQAVEVRPVEQADGNRTRTKKRNTLYDNIRDYIGIVDDLPPDASRNIDRDLYGAEEDEGMR
jgi:hypothetical protein